MMLYRVTLLGADGEVQSRYEHNFDDDDAALDEVGRSCHPHRIEVHQEDRLVGAFPPLPTRSL